ncbi:hypothetical protein ACFDHY_03055 [Staphylococcus hyicus]|uniref:hypothetical protein n=1 Tax=Staphylococcus hyicus TaxID=1284 RepID=UPI0036D26010
MNKNVLNLINKGDGNQIKQGDKSKITFELTDSNKDLLDLGQSAKVYLSKSKNVYEFDADIKDNTVDLVINQIIPSGTYTVEVVANGYVFPSDNTVHITVTPSVLGRAIDKVESSKLYDEVIKYGLDNGAFEILKVTDEQIVNAMKQDYVDAIGELDVMFLTVKDKRLIYPFVFAKKDARLSEGQTYEEWKVSTKERFQGFFDNPESGVNSVADFYQKVEWWGIFNIPFPIEFSVKVEGYGQDFTQIYSNNYLVPIGLCIHEAPNQITIRHVFNNNPIEQNKLELDITL